MGNILAGALIMLIGVLVGVAVKNRNTPEDGFTLLLKEIQKLQRPQWEGEVHSCLHCDYKVNVISELDRLEMKHHLETKHADQLGGEKLVITDSRIL